MTLVRKPGATKAPQAQNAGTSQAVPRKTVDNLFDEVFSIEQVSHRYLLHRGNKVAYFKTLDDLMTFLADQAIEKMGRVEQ